MEDNVKLIISSSNEHCDTYDCIWKIDSVLVGNPKLKGKDIWLQNSKLDYKDDSLKVYYSVFGDYLGITIGSDFIGCRPTYEFYDLFVKKVDSVIVSKN
jgi:hypothetical protein